MLLAKSLRQNAAHVPKSVFNLRQI